MTFPAVPLGQQFHHKRLANDASDVAPNLSMHNAIDLPLDAAAGRLLTAPGQGLECTVSFTNQVTTPNNSIVLWDTVLSDPSGMYNPATGMFTCPFDGIYLVNMNWVQAVAMAQTYVTLGPLDDTIYPNNYFLHTRQSSGAIANDGALRISNFPIVAAAGDQFRFASPGATGLTLTSHAANTNGPFCFANVQYVGAIPGTLPLDSSIYPLAGSQWTPGETVNDRKLAHRFTDLMNELQPYIMGQGGDRVMFLGSSQGEAIASGNPCTMPSVDFDNAAGWNATDFYYTIPKDGLYAVGASMVQAATGTAPQFTVDGWFSDDMSISGSGGLNGASLGYTQQYEKGATLQLYPYEAYSTWAVYSTYLAVVQLA